MTDTPTDAATGDPTDGPPPAGGPPPAAGDVMTEPPASGPFPAAAPRLVRLPAHGRVSGVSAGIAQYLGIDVALVRVAFVLLTFAGGVGLALYAAMYFLTPVGDGTEPPRTTRDLSFWAAVGLFVLAGVLALDGAGDGGLVVAIALVAIGVAIWRRDDGVPVGEAPAVAGGAAAQPTAYADGRARERVPVREQAPDWQAPPAPARERSWLGGATLALALLVSAGLVTTNLAGVTDLGAGEVASGSMLVLGAGLLVGTWIGRARWLVLPAVVLLPVMVIGGLVSESNLDVDLGGGLGQRTFEPADEAALAEGYRLLAGDLTLDLTNLTFDDEAAAAIDVAFGAITVIVPDDVGVTVDVMMAGGEIRFLDDELVAGSGLDQSFASPGTDGAPQIDLSIDVTFGEVTIIREPRRA